MIRHTTWKPDTCSCEIVLAWEDSIPSPDHMLERVNHKCQVHSISSDSDVLEKVFEENRRKNKAFAELQKDIPALTPEFYEWSFDDKRDLTITLHGPDFETKDKIRNNLNSHFGSKVKLD